MYREEYIEVLVRGSASLVSRIDLEGLPEKPVKALPAKKKGAKDKKAEPAPPEERKWMRATVDNALLSSTVLLESPLVCDKAAFHHDSLEEDDKTGRRFEKALGQSIVARKDVALNSDVVLALHFPRGGEWVAVSVLVTQTLVGPFSALSKPIFRN